VKSKICGLYAVTPDEPDTSTLAGKVQQALNGGASLVQYRNKSAGIDLKREQGRTLAALCRKAGVPFIINDDLMLALELDADGVHLGGEDGDLAQARKLLGRGRLLGASCYDRVELALAAAQAGADYVAFGSVYSSGTKPGTVHAPLTIFARARAQIVLPLVAIGGITLQNASWVYAAGADSVAVISAVFDSADIAASAAGFTRLHQQQQMQQ
jgi:thiamine-phosphate pyrophosphorylase